MDNQDSEDDSLPDIVNYNKIEEGLYLGNLTAALDLDVLKNLHISHILTVDSKPLPGRLRNIPGLSFLYIGKDDMAFEDLLTHFPKIIDFIRDGQEKGNILVHCYFGVSRSACAVIAFLMSKYRIDYEEALNRVKLKRRCVGPNSGFVDQLILFHRMNFCLDANHEAFRHYRLVCAGQRFERGKFSLDVVPKSVNEESGPKSERKYKCKTCRSLLYNDSSRIFHSPSERPSWSSPLYGKTETECQRGIFLLPEEWMGNLKEPEGKLLCPKCGQKVGAFNWRKGYACSCSATVKPGFFVVPSKIDIC